MGEPARQVSFLPAAQRMAAVPPPAEAPTNLSDYIRTADPRYLSCREGRHYYPRVTLSERRFKRDALGYDIYTVDCEVCGEAFRKETWLIKEDGKGNVLDVRFMGAKTEYHKPIGGGRSPYLLPKGSGYISPSDLLETRVSEHLKENGVRRLGRRSAGGTG